MTLATAQYRPLFDAAAHLAGLPTWKGWEPGIWLEALALVESSGNPKARHYDAGHDAMDRGNAESWASYGLFQIEGETARRMTGSGQSPLDYTWLYFPEINTALAVRILAANIQQYGTVDKAIAAYNGGRFGATVQPSGDLGTQEYVDRVATNAALVAADRG